MLMSRLNRQQSARLLEAALDAGITHYDTARLYGYGEAEAALGDAIRGRREQVTITTKVGILPPKRTPVLSMAKFVARKAAAMVPQLRSSLRRRADAMIQPGVFDLATVTASFETSLRQLKTDNVDVLLLHECAEEELRNDDLLRFLENVQRQGKVRYYGLAATVPVTEFALIHAPQYAPVIQVPNSAFALALNQLDLGTKPAIFTHSSLSVGFAQLTSELAAKPAWAAAWSKRMGFDCTDRKALGKVALQYAMCANPHGVVLFSSANEDHIRANARTADADPVPEQMEMFLDLVREFQAGRAGAVA